MHHLHGEASPSIFRRPGERLSGRDVVRALEEGHAAGGSFELTRLTGEGDVRFDVGLMRSRGRGSHALWGRRDARGFNYVLRDGLVARSIDSFAGPLPSMVSRRARGVLGPLIVWWRQPVLSMGQDGAHRTHTESIARLRFMLVLGQKVTAHPLAVSTVRLLRGCEAASGTPALRAMSLPGDRRSTTWGQVRHSRRAASSHSRDRSGRGSGISLVALPTRFSTRPAPARGASTYEQSDN